MLNYLEFITDRKFLFESTKLYLYALSQYYKPKISLYFLQIGVFIYTNIAVFTQPYN